ncbi:hypothetical protein OG978_34830 [Streptomyces sp. NBC_01591]|uniref:DUF6924 domain-containing protein n=1 Tax=Streptomyces sp. NBC_01591 TaxID=2975888 RepID=UPI002DD86797|nr:hypothetical protein [Streptomyces sp. NBC_01591]WSD72118.1 hypothetical protein OG978_34830 [Streptomyces sp. NBC_01591]
MKALPEILGRDEFDALIIRTDYGDEAAWQAVVADLAQPWGDDGEFEPSVHLVDNPAWADLTSDEVLNEARRDENLSVVFLADRVTMQSAHRALLALDITEEEELDPVYYQELIDSRLPREFRTVPAGVHDVHANLSIANVDFAEFAEAAFADPDRIYRSF